MPPDDPVLNQGHRYPIKSEMGVQGRDKIGEKLEKS